ncbi:MAG: NAD(P)/FAD-dependent oxidoreductase [Myxococcales bacterium]|nr:NAD(P)/FAD-dependent oxidoreductase [Myxococcales bacterium]
MSTPIHDVIIIGAGFSGLGMGIALDKAGLHDFVILERDDEVGGTWWANQYPGCACDVESQLYSFSFELNPRWSHVFARQPEILEYLKGVADKYDLRRRLRLKTAATSAVFDESTSTWEVTTELGDKLRARAVASCGGGLSQPSFPQIEGLGTFAGKQFHSAKWDHATSLEGKRVGVIGTGASAIQIVPSIAPSVGELHLFQRTPPWIVPRLDRPIGDLEKRVYASFPALQWLIRAQYYWRRELLIGPALVSRGRLTAFLEKLARAHLERSVADPALRAKLLPSYVIGCKRILISNDYYPALQRPNVELVTDGIERVEPNGVRTRDGRLHELDALVLATGFEAAEHAVRFPVLGRRGKSLADQWKDGMEAYLGTTVSGFPNFFVIPGPNIGGGHNSLVFMIEAQIHYAVEALKTLRAKGAAFFDVLPEAQARYNRAIAGRFENTVWASGCRAWYQTQTGKQTVLYPDLTYKFYLATRRFDADSYEIVDRRAASREAAQAPVATA